MSSTRPSINIHPNSHQPSLLGLSQTHFDVLVIGGGPSGGSAAINCAISGLSVLLVEAELAGGECGNWACIPSKALLRPLEIVAEGSHVGGAKELLVRTLQEQRGVNGQNGKGDAVVDLEGAWAFRDKCTNSWNDASGVAAMESLGVKVARGFASFVGPRKVQVKGWHDDDVLVVTADAVVLATGSEPVIPDIEGLKAAGYWTPREAVSAKEVPDHLIILGAGLVGCEMATVYGQFGSNVSLIAKSDKILSKVVNEAAERVAKSLVQKGVNIKTNADVTSVRRDGKKVEIVLADGLVIAGSEILVAVGRRARTAGMALGSIEGVEEGKPINVDESTRAVDVADGWLYAVGDINGSGWTTHMGMYHATVAANNIIAKKKGLKPSYDLLFSTKFSMNAVPQVCFTDPAIAWVGMSLKQAEEKGIRAREVSVNTSGPGSHVYLQEERYEGWAQWVLEIGTGKLLGATFVGRGTANLLHASTVAIVGGMSWMQMLHAVPSFPTLSEAYWLLVQKSALTEEQTK